MVGKGQESGATPGNQNEGNSSSVTDKAAEQVTSRLDSGKEYVVQSITGVAQALRQTGQHLRDEGAQPSLAQFADRGAEQIEVVGGYLRKRDTSQLLADAEGFARRQPMIFASSAFALGMLAVRFLRSGSQPQPSAASGSTSPTYGASSAGTPPMAGRTGSGATPGSTPLAPRTFAGAAQDAPNRAPTAQPRPASGVAANPGTPVAPGAGMPPTPSERPTPRPGTTPSVGGTSTGSGGAPSTTARPGTGGRNQP